MNELVSIVIPTWQRHELLLETLKHLNEQTYKNIEIIVVCDGQDPKLLLEVSNLIYHNIIDKEFKDNCELNFVQLGRNWSGLDQSSFGIAPLLVGYLMAKGEYIMPWCDDERAMTNEYIDIMVRAMETPCEEPDWTNSEERLIYPDFVYPRVKLFIEGQHLKQKYGTREIEIGQRTPSEGQITHYMFRPYNFIKFGYPRWNSHPVDWSLIQDWMKKGARWTFINELLFQHKVDH